MKIIVIIDECSGGAWESTLESLLRIKKNKVDCEIILVAQKPRPEEKLSQLFNRCYFYKKPRCTSPFKLFRQNIAEINSQIRLLRQENHCNAIVSVSATGVYSSFLMRIPSVYWFHGWKSSFMVGTKHKNIHEYCLFLWEKIALNLADKLLVPAEQTKKIIQSLLVNKKKITILQNPIKAEFANHLIQLKVVTPTLGVSGFGKRYIAYVGRIAPHKGIEELVGAYASEESLQRECDLVLAYPDFPIDNKIMSVIKHNMRKIRWGKIRLIKGQDAHTLKELYQRAILVMLPSFVEHSPMVMWECLASGGLFIGSSTGDMPTILGSVDQRLVLPEVTRHEIIKKIYWAISLKSNERRLLTQKLNKTYANKLNNSSSLLEEIKKVIRF